MKTNTHKPILPLLFGLMCSLVYSQVQLPKMPVASGFKDYTSEHGMPKSSVPNTRFQIPRSNGLAIYEQDRLRVEQQEEALKQAYAELNAGRINIALPSYSNIESTKHYRNAFDKLLELNPNEFSIKKATFIIENAFFEEEKEDAEFDAIIEQSGDFIREKMKELDFDQNSNLAKNFMLFKFFSDTLQIKSKNLKHLPLKYDFEDYMGIKDWSKMFVSKLLSTGKGQCNSLPRLYLILAEEIGAEAYLSLSPNHSYIKFRDEDDNWYNVELTNGMFTTDSMILQSGFIKSEALQKGIYMQQLTSKQLFSQLLTDFGGGYTRKYGYDAFVKKVIDKALELNPNSISANMFNADFLTVQFKYAAKQVGINTRDRTDLQNIRFYPEIAQLLSRTNAQYSKVDDLGFEFMSPEAYQKWLASLLDTEQQESNKDLQAQFNQTLNQTFKD